MIAKAKAAKTESGAVAIERLILVWRIRSAKSLSLVEEEMMTLWNLDLRLKIICKSHITGSDIPL